VRWTDTRDRLCIGRSAPVMLRAPYFGLGADTCVTPETRLKRHGADVEYLAGTDTVLVRAADLVSGPAARFERSRPLRRFHHIMLDDPACLNVWRCRVETAFLSEVLASQDGSASRRGPMPRIAYRRSRCSTARPRGRFWRAGRGAELRGLRAPPSRLVEERGHLDDDHRVVVQRRCISAASSSVISSPARLPVGARAVARDIQRREVRLFQNGDGFAHGLGLIDAGRIAQERRARGVVGQAVTGLAADLDDEGVDVMTAGGFALLGMARAWAAARAVKRPGRGRSITTISGGRPMRKGSVVLPRPPDTISCFRPSVKAP
jgi:hypothetical protein